MQKKKAPKINRMQAREMERKFTPAIKALSSFMHNTTNTTDDLLGYKIPAGTFKDKFKREWQIQAHAVCSKGMMMKSDEVKPMIRKWAIGLKFRVFIKYLVEWSNK